MLVHRHCIPLANAAMHRAHKDRGSTHGCFQYYHEPAAQQTPSTNDFVKYRICVIGAGVPDSKPFKSKAVARFGRA